MLPREIGKARLAVESDAGVVTDWVRGFRDDVHGSSEPPVDAGPIAERWTREGRLWLWEDRGEPVSMTGWGARTPRGARISMVYTPASRRGQGYAAMVVAHVARVIFADGCAFCCLFADRTNAASNRVYERLGFERRAGFRQWSLVG
jgi:predicted GNAT family acetyltransferase